MQTSSLTFHSSSEGKVSIRKHLNIIFVNGLPVGVEVEGHQNPNYELVSAGNGIYDAILSNGTPFARIIRSEDTWTYIPLADLSGVSSFYGEPVKDGDWFGTYAFES